MSADPFTTDTFPGLWDRFSDRDPIDDPDGFLSAAEEMGLIELVDVDAEALDDPFAYERGIEPGGMMWRLTDAGRQRYGARP